MENIKTQLTNIGYETEHLFLPEEFDVAFAGFATMAWNHGVPVYNVDKFPIGKEFPEVPDDMQYPIFYSECTIDDLNIGDLFLEQRGDLDSAIIGKTTDGRHVIYEYDKLIEAYMEYYIRMEVEAGPDGTHLMPLQEENETYEEWHDRVTEDAYNMAADQISVNTQRDYSYMEVSPIVIEDVSDQLDFEEEEAEAQEA